MHQLLFPKLVKVTLGGIFAKEFRYTQCRIYLRRGESKPESRSGKGIIAGKAFRLELQVR